MGPWEEEEGSHLVVCEEEGAEGVPRTQSRHLGLPDCRVGAGPGPGSLGQGHRAEGGFCSSVEGVVGAVEEDGGERDGDLGEGLPGEAGAWGGRGEGGTPQVVALWGISIDTACFWESLN